MNYILVKDTPEIPAFERAKEISRGLYELTYPVHLGNTSYLLFDVQKTDKGSYIAVADLAHQIKVHPQASLTKLMLMFPELTIEKKGELEDYINNNDTVVLQALIPSTSEIKDYDWMVENGWIIKP